MVKILDLGSFWPKKQDFGVGGGACPRGFFFLSFLNFFFVLFTQITLQYLEINEKSVKITNRNHLSLQIITC